MTTYRGQSLPRFEDDRLLRGNGSFVDDLPVEGVLHAAVLRSVHAHARITSIDVAAAEDLPGVVTVLTGASLEGKLGDIGSIRREGMGETPIPEHPVLARDQVMYVGQPVAIVIAESLYGARDAAALIEIAYEPLSALIDQRESAAAKSPLHPHVGTNVVMRTTAGTGDVAEAFEQADRIVRGSYFVPRLVGMAIECRGVLASYDAGNKRLTMWSSTQMPHRVKSYLGAMLPQQPLEVRVIAPDVGGGFGRKSDVWPEEIAIGYAAIELRRPVKWIEERSENMLAAHGRGYTADVEAAVKSDGRVLALRIRMIADLGAYFLPSSGGPLGNVVQRVAGPYKIPAMEVECLGVMTNKPPTGPYRGAGGPEAAVPTERIFDAIAAELEMDPAELRRVNFVPSNAFPYDTATGLTYDSGDFQTAFDRALELADYDGVRRGQRGATGGTLRGIGVGTAVKASGGKAGVRRSLARVEIDRGGHVDVFTDVSPHGQGTETSFSQIAGDVLGIEPSQITVHHGDTNSLATGGGTTATRGLAVGGNAVYEALQAAKATIREAASGLLRCPADQVTLAGGNALSGLDRHAAVSFAEVAEAAHRKARIAGMPEAALVFEVDYTLPANPYGFAAHVATVDIDRGTGEIRLAGYVAVHDCGPMINPMIVRGQIQGGITQGIGQALSEGVFYDEQGQPLNGSLMTYGVPNAEDTPAFVLENQETPSPTNALGIKGIGELPTVASPVAIANAVADALAQAGVSMAGVDMPLTPEKIWRALNRVG